MIRLRSKIMRKWLLVIVLPLVLELIFMSTLSLFLMRAGADIERRIESKKVVGTATAIVAGIIDAQLVTTMYNAHRIPMLDTRFDEVASRTSDLLADLKRLCASDPKRSKMASEIDISVGDTFRKLRRFLSDDYEQDAVLKKYAGTEKQSKRIYKNMTVSLNFIDDLVAIEQKTQSMALAHEKFYRNSIRQAIIWGVALNVVLAVVLAIYFARTITGRLAVVLTNTDRLLKREELSPPISGDDELSQLDEVFHATARDLRSVDRQRKHLVSLVKEELGTPLRQVQYTLHNLSQGVYGDLTAKAENRLTLAARDTDRVMRLIDDLLSVETMDGARFSLDLNIAPTSELFTLATGSVKDMADRHSVKLEIIDCRANVVGDKNRLIQVLINFLSNAIKFSRPGDTVTVQSSVCDNQQIEVRVIDRGRGVPEDKLDDIFQPFQQVEEGDQIARGGTGLGLPISKTIIEQHGGTIGVRSTVGQGSTFWFRLRLAEEAGADDGINS